MQDNLTKAEKLYDRQHRRRFGRKYRPAKYIDAALCRLSRDRWLPPNEVFRIAFALSHCFAYGSGWGKLAESGCPCGSLQVGLYRGKALLPWDDPAHSLVARICDDKKLLNKPLALELAVLQAVLKTRRAK